MNYKAQAVMQAISDAVASLPNPVTVGKVADVQVNALTRLVSGIEVDLPTGRTECEWTGSAEADILAHQPLTAVGRDALVVVTKGRAFLTGIIWTGA